ncbi:hypothetical protein V1524DRAFT_411855 [Lipomyces starkeyi]
MNSTIRVSTPLQTNTTPGSNAWKCKACLTRSSRPIGPAKWDQVVDAYEDYHSPQVQFPNQLPETDGRPHLSTGYKRAKEISRMINESVEMADLYDIDIVDFTEKQDDERAYQQEEILKVRELQTLREPDLKLPLLPNEERTVASEVPLSRKKNNKGVTDSLVAFLDVEKREEREHKYDIITLYQSQIEHLQQALRESKENCRDWRQIVEELRQKSEDLRQKFDEERIQFQGERTDLIGERDRELQKIMVLELLNAQS